MEAIVMYPSPAIGHLISMVELSKLIFNHKPSLSIHIVIFELPYNDGSTAPYVNEVSASLPSIIFHHLPTIALPPSTISSSSHRETLVFEVLHLNNPNLHHTLVSISTNYTISAFIADFFSACALPITRELNIPAYVFSTSGASVMSSFLYFPTIHKSTTKNFKDIDAILHIPGVPPVPSKDMPMPLLERDDKAYGFFLDCSINWSRSAAGIIVNTFEYLEQRAIKAIKEGRCVLDGPTPPIYSIGPLTAADDRRGGSGGDENHKRPECLTWLDSQPSKSVVFLCFGSLGLFSVEQLKEIAIGLEKSRRRFLWVVKNPPSEGETVAVKKQTEPDLDAILPEGFLQRTSERGFVQQSWAPQVEILSHESVGGFVTHCGWNSVLEAVMDSWWKK